MRRDVWTVDCGLWKQEPPTPVLVPSWSWSQSNGVVSFLPGPGLTAPLQSRQIHFFFIFLSFQLQVPTTRPLDYCVGFPSLSNVATFLVLLAGAASDCCCCRCCCVRRSWLWVVVARLVLASFVFHTDSCHPIIPRNPLHHRLVSSV